MNKVALFTVDENKCKRDGICISECPRKIIEMKDKTSVPTPTDGADRQCNRCGHCVAVCPHGAISHSAMKPEDCPPVMQEMALSPEHVEHFLRSRRSIRSYKSKEVDRKTLAKLIDIAHYAPTGTNSQQVGWIAINSRDRVHEISGMIIDVFRTMIEDCNPIAARLGASKLVEAWDAGIDIITRGAPALVFAYAPNEYSLSTVDCTSAISYLDLAAPSLGLGTCWAGFVMLVMAQHPSLQDSIGVPKGHSSRAAMMVGYPKYKYQRLPLRNKANISWL